VLGCTCIDRGPTRAALVLTAVVGNATNLNHTPYTLNPTPWNPMDPTLAALVLTKVTGKPTTVAPQPRKASPAHRSPAAEVPGRAPC